MKYLILFFFISTPVFSSSNYDKVMSTVTKLTNKNSHLDKFTLGKNDQGKQIFGVLYKGSSRVKTNHLVVSTHHGNEVLSADLAVEFLEFLAKSGSDKFKDKNIFIIPVLNIGGYNIENREEIDANGISHDPNRDYPDPCIQKKNFKLKSTAHLSRLVKENDIVGAITIHGYYGSLTYPWGIYTDQYETLDHEIFNSKAALAVKDNSYVVGTHADILYPAGGAFEDWAYFELGVWSLLVELENSPKFEDDISMLVSSINSFPKTRSSDHRHLGRCTQFKDFGISRP